jgi:hypothetical protein
VMIFGIISYLSAHPKVNLQDSMRSIHYGCLFRRTYQ